MPKKMRLFQDTLSSLIPRHGKTSAEPFYWTVGKNHGHSAEIKKRNSKILPYGDCSGDLWITGNSQSWDMLVGVFVGCTAGRWLVRSEAKPWKSLLGMTWGSLENFPSDSGGCWVNPNRTSSAGLGLNQEPTELEADAPSHGLFIQILICSAALLLSPPQCSYPTHWPFPNHLQSH